MPFIHLFSFYFFLYFSPKTALKLESTLRAPSSTGLTEEEERRRAAPAAPAHLVHGAEDVGVVLLEAADAGQARQSPRQLVAVQDAKVGHAQRQLPPGARPVIKHQAAGRQDRRIVSHFQLKLPCKQLNE